MRSLLYEMAECGFQPGGVFTYVWGWLSPIRTGEKGIAAWLLRVSQGASGRTGSYCLAISDVMARTADNTAPLTRLVTAGTGA
jgi:hypothetical protein